MDLLSFVAWLFPLLGVVYKADAKRGFFFVNQRRHTAEFWFLGTGTILILVSLFNLIESWATSEQLDNLILGGLGALLVVAGLYCREVSPSLLVDTKKNIFEYRRKKFLSRAEILRGETQDIREVELVEVELQEPASMRTAGYATHIKRVRISSTYVLHFKYRSICWPFYEGEEEDLERIGASLASILGMQLRRKYAGEDNRPIIDHIKDLE